jgi:phosphoribosylanthranilate isomerase
MTKIKICGITNLGDLDLVTGFGVDAVGVITGIPSSPRNVALEDAKTLIEKTPIFTKSVLIIAPRTVKEAVEVCEFVNPDAVQIHGGNIDAVVISSALKNYETIMPVSANIPQAKESAICAAELFNAVLLDSSTLGQIGGTGKVHDWSLSRLIREAIKPKNLILAGGLNAENVKDAIYKVKPYAVDACTGTEEQPGIKDAEKVQRFVSSVKETERRYLNE